MTSSKTNTISHLNVDHIAIRLFTMNHVTFSSLIRLRWRSITGAKLLKRDVTTVSQSSWCIWRLLTVCHGIPRMLTDHRQMETEEVAQRNWRCLYPHILPIHSLCILSEPGACCHTVCSAAESDQYPQFQIHNRNFWSLLILTCADESLAKHHLTVVWCSWLRCICLLENSVCSLLLV